MKQSPRNIFEIFSCSWALENFQPVPGSQIVGEGLRRSCSPQFPPVLFSCLPFLNSTDPTISQPGTGQKILGILEGSERIFPRKRSLGATGKNISDILACSSCATPFSVFTTFRRHLGSITEKTHGNMESIFLIDVEIQRYIAANNCHSQKGNKFVNFRLNFSYFCIENKGESKSKL